MIKGFRQIALLTILSRILGMIRDMRFSRFLGAGGVMEAWVIAFTIPNLSRRLFGEGAASASFIPVYRQLLDKDPDHAPKLVNTIVTVIFVILAAAVLAGWAGIWVYNRFVAHHLATKSMLSLVALMLPYTIMICTVAILAGVLNVHKHFAAPAAAPIVLNIFIITAVLLTGWHYNLLAYERVFFTAIAVLLAGGIQLAIQLPPLWASGVSIRPGWDINSEAFKKVIYLMGPMIIGLTATQLNTLADFWIAKFFSGSVEKGEFFTLLGAQIRYPLWDGAVSHLYYSQRLYQFPLGVLGISLATAIFPVMSANAAKNDFNLLSTTVARGIKGAIFLAVPAIFGLILVAKPLVAVLFERGKFTADDTAQTAAVLWFYAFGLTGFFCQQILARAFYAFQDSKVPARSAMTAVCINIVLNLILIWYLGTPGLALSTVICSYLQVVILILALRRRLGQVILQGLGVTTAKTITASALMAPAAFAMLLLSKNLGDIAKLSLVVPTAVAVYFLAAKLLNIEELDLLTDRKQKQT